MADERILRVLDPNDHESYLDLLQSIESFRSVAIAQYGLFLTGNERTAFAKEVLETVKSFSQKVKDLHSNTWTPDASQPIAGDSSNCGPHLCEDNFGRCIPCLNLRVTP